MVIHADPDAAPSAEQLAGYEGLVSRAAGIDLERGDAVEVAAMPFSVLPTEPVEPTVLPWQDPLTVGLSVAGLLLLLFAVALILWLRARARRRREEEEAQGARLEQERRAAIAAKSEIVELPEPAPEAVVLQENIRNLRQRARDQASDDIRRTATVISRWLREAADEKEEAA